jgi:two-component system LytT family sensor kinase
MGGTAEFSSLGVTFHALAFATGAALSVLMAVMQGRSLGSGGTRSGLTFLPMWGSAFLWTAGAFVWMILLLSGFEAESRPVLFARTIAWSSTAIGQVALAWLFHREGSAPLWWRNLMFALASVWSVVFLALFWWPPLAPGAPLDTESVSILGFVVTLLFFVAYAPGFLRARRQMGSRAPNPWFLRIGAGLAIVQLVGTGMSIALRDAPVFRTMGEIVGAQWPIPWVIFAAVFFARTHYADVILKRSLALIGSVVVGALAVWWLPGIGESAPRVFAALLVAALILATPAALRGLGWLIDRVLLRRPDYRELRRVFTEEARRAASEDDLFERVCASVGEALHLEARFVSETDPRPPGAERIGIPGPSGVHHLELAVTSEARALLQEERSFLEAIASEASRRLESLAFERERAERQLREGRLQHAVTEAELKALRAQVDPHFLFNTLNAIADLVSSDPAKAEAMTERLAAFFRYTLASQHRAYSTLDEELEFVRQYLGIEQVRFGERLRVDVSSEASLGANRVPTLILQPLVENAVRHGLAPRREGGRVSVSARREGAVLQLEVADDGVGMPREEGRRRGIGLENVRARLDALYGAASSMSIEAGAHGRGTRIRLRLPAHDH